VTNFNVAVFHTTYKRPANENPVSDHGQLYGGRAGPPQSRLTRACGGQVPHISATPAQERHFRAAASNVSCWFHSIKAVRAGIFLQAARPALKKVPDKETSPKQKSMKKNKEHREYEH